MTIKVYKRNGMYDGLEFVKDYYCHECKKRQPASKPLDRFNPDFYKCDVCGEAILCDECGYYWTDDHPDHT